MLFTLYTASEFIKQQFLGMQLAVNPNRILCSTYETYVVQKIDLKIIFVVKRFICSIEKAI
jgi:hypothetical protein